MRRLILAAALVGAGTVQGLADNPTLALDVGTVIGSEKPCGLTYDQAAIEAYIGSGVGDGNPRFLLDMNNAVDAMAFQWGQFTQSRKTAHCAQVKRLAKKFGFMK